MDSPEIAGYLYGDTSTRNSFFMDSRLAIDETLTLAKEISQFLLYGFKWAGPGLRAAETASQFLLYGFLLLTPTPRPKAENARNSFFMDSNALKKRLLRLLDSQFLLYGFVLSEDELREWLRVASQFLLYGFGGSPRARKRRRPSLAIPSLWILRLLWLMLTIRSCLAIPSLWIPITYISQVSFKSCVLFRLFSYSLPRRECRN